MLNVTLTRKRGKFSGPQGRHEIATTVRSWIEVGK
jgi:hypothetical protein